MKVQPELMSQQEMEVRVRIDAARRQRVAFENVRVLQVAAQTWPDDRLGCSARKGAAPTRSETLIAFPGSGTTVRLNADRKLTSTASTRQGR